MTKLTGVTFAYNAISQDYCWGESIRSLKELCHEVIVLDAGSTDGSDKFAQSFSDNKTKIILCDNEEWKSQQGKWKLSYFTNKAIDEVSTDWFYYQQADEVTHEKSYTHIHQAISGANAEAYFISRINLWASPYLRLNVEHNRKPCSDVIIRLAKSNHRSYDDAESIGADNVSAEYIDLIRMYHFGFVRDRKLHTEKIRHMQADVFNVGVDEKLKGMDIFDPYKWFSAEDLMPINEPLPKIMEQWAKNRCYD